MDIQSYRWVDSIHSLQCHYSHMANPKLKPAEVRARFLAVGHTPTFADDDYTGALSKLSFVCGICGAKGTTSCASVTMTMHDNPGSAHCSKCRHQKGVDAAYAAADKLLLVTSEGTFTIREAMERYGIPRGTIKTRHHKGWSPDEVCGITQRRPKVPMSGRVGIVYGWWCTRTRRYVYVGLTLQALAARTQRHFADAEKGSSAPLHAAIRKFGKSRYEIHTLWSGDAEKVQAKEVSFIRKHKTSVDHGGFNVHAGGNVGCQGGIPSEYKGGKHASLKDLWREHKSVVPYHCFCRRVRNGWSMDRALFEIAWSSLSEIRRNAQRKPSLSTAPRPNGTAK